MRGSPWDFVRTKIPNEKRVREGNHVRKTVNSSPLMESLMRTERQSWLLILRISSLFGVSAGTNIKMAPHDMTISGQVHTLMGMLSPTSVAVPEPAGENDKREDRI